MIKTVKPLILYTTGPMESTCTLSNGISLTNFKTSPAFKFTFCSGSFKQLYFWLRM